MKKTIYTKFLAGFLIFIASAILFISYRYNKNVLKSEISAAAMSLYNQVNGISQYYSDNYYNIYADSKEHDYNGDIKSFMLPSDTTLWIVSNNGMIMYSSNKREVGLNIGDLSAYFHANFYTTTAFDDISDEKVVSVYSPIVNTYKTYGYVVMNKTISSIKASCAPVLNYIYITLLLALTFSLVILIVFHFNVYRPVKKLSKAAGEYAKGNFDYEGLKINSKDELGDIAEKLKFMAAEMKETDNTQKKFIANISHDFRSPLTSIKGYIEAILDGTIPPELYEKYLNILLFETERLNKLTGSLLLLNTWDAKGTKLDLSDFDLVPLTRNIVATFEGQCSKKKITLDVLFGSKSYMVNGDQTKIQQVLYNLIDNAIKFSHNSSSINISITDKNEKIFVSVKDSGIGIPKDNLNKIWDRFYKTDLSRGKDKTGTGLGLSIVKEVITCHGENINVISTEGVGTEFIFTLQKSKKPLLPIVSP